MRNLVMDLRFGKVLGGTYLQKIKPTENSDYEALSRIFKNRINDDDILVDVGCGNGRVINWWLQHHPKNKMIGIELSEEIASKTSVRLQRFPNVTIIQGNAIESLPDDGTLFYFYNPFKRDVVRKFNEQIKRQFKSTQNVRFFYYNCKYVDIFERDPKWHVEFVDLGGPSSAPFDTLAIMRLIE